MSMSILAVLVRVDQISQRFHVNAVGFIFELSQSGHNYSNLTVPDLCKSIS